MAQDLTKGSITRSLLMTALPTMIGFGAQMFYDLVDIFWLGRISGNAIAGVTVFSTVFWIFEALNEVIGMSSVSLISQAFGRKDREGTDLAIEQTITFKFVAASIAAILLLVLIRPLMGLFVKGNAAQLGLEYGYIRIFFLPIMFSSFSVNTVLRCIGEAGIVMKIMLLSSLLNIVLDPILMFSSVPYIGIPGLGLGAFGAALATIIAQTIAFVTGMWFVFSGRFGIQPSLKRLFRLNREVAVKLLTIGLPNGAEVLLRNLSGSIALWFVGAFGTAAIAASGTAGRVLGFAFMPLMGLAIGGSAMAGQSLGAGDVHRAEKTGRIAGLISAGSMLVLTIVALIFGSDIMRLFTSDPDVIRYGTQMMNYGMAGLVFVGYGIGIGSVFAGSGYNLPAFISGLTGRWLLQIPFLFLVVKVLKLPIAWVWFSYMLGEFGEMVVNVAFFRAGRWRHKRVTV